MNSQHKFLMYPHFIQMVLHTETINNTIYLVKCLKAKVFGNMRSGFTGDETPLSVAMLFASNPCAGSLRPSDAQFALVHTLELSSSASHHSTHKESPILGTDDILKVVPTLLDRINGLEKQLTRTNKKVERLEHALEELGVSLPTFADEESENSSKQGGIGHKQLKENP